MLDDSGVVIHLRCQNCGTAYTLPDGSDPTQYYCTKCGCQVLLVVPPPPPPQPNPVITIGGAAGGAAIGGTIGGPAGAVIGAVIGLLIGAAAARR